MRNLKKVLSLVLALAMVLSICMVGASAVNYDDFTDEESIVKKQAVETLVSLDVIKGYNDGATFNPTGNVTRAEMATMICRVLAGGDNMIVDATKPVATYADIDGHWAESYIEYCTSLGIVSGKSPSSFDPQADVTAAEAAKMVMTTLGYNADIEGFKGIGWDINTMAKANTLKLLDNLQGEISANVPMTREQVAQLLFNALDDPMVQNYVGNNANLWIGSGANAYQQTLLESKFNAEKVVGVVVANEWADLDDDEPLGKGKTRVIVLGTDNMPTKTELTLNLTTGLDKIGESIIVYRDTNSNRVIFGDWQDTGLNQITEFTSYTKDITKGEGAVDKSAKDAEQYVNFDDGLTNTYTARARFTVRLPEDVDIVTGNNDTDPKDEIVIEETFNRNADVTFAKYVEEGGRYEDPRVLDSDVLTVLEAAYDEVNHNNSTKAFLTNADNYDTFEDWCDVYLTAKSVNGSINALANENGNYIKVVDYNNDGDIDYVLKTIYTASTVKRIAKNGDITLTDVIDEASNCNHINDKIKLTSEDELAAGDVVLYTVIDGTAYVTLAETMEHVRIDKVHKNDITVTTMDGDTYNESGVNMIFKVDAMDDLGGVTRASEDNWHSIISMAGKTDYDIFFDLYGNIVAYRTSLNSGAFTLLTDGWYAEWKDREEFSVKAFIDDKIGTYDVDGGAKTFVIEGGVSLNNSWGMLKPFGSDMNTVSPAPDYRADDFSYNTTVASYAMDDETLDLTAVDRVNSGNRRNVDVIALDKVDLKKGDNKYLVGDAFESKGQGLGDWSAKDAFTYPEPATYLDDSKINEDADANDKYLDVRVRPRTDTVYYYVYTNNSGKTVVDKYEGYTNAPSVDKADISGMYAVGTEYGDYYIANVIVVELTRYRTGGELIFVYDAPERVDQVGKDHFDIIRKDGTAESNVLISHDGALEEGKLYLMYEDGDGYTVAIADEVDTAAEFKDNNLWIGTVDEWVDGVREKDYVWIIPQYGLDALGNETQPAAVAAGAADEKRLELTGDKYYTLGYELNRQNEQMATLTQADPDDVMAENVGKDENLPNHVLVYANKDGQVIWAVSFNPDERPFNGYATQLWENLRPEYVAGPATVDVKDLIDKLTAFVYDVQEDGATTTSLTDVASWKTALKGAVEDDTLAITGAQRKAATALLGNTMPDTGLVKLAENVLAGLTALDEYKDAVDAWAAGTYPPAARVATPLETAKTSVLAVLAGAIDKNATTGVLTITGNVNAGAQLTALAALITADAEDVLTWTGTALQPIALEALTNGLTAYGEQEGLETEVAAVLAAVEAAYTATEENSAPAILELYTFTKTGDKLDLDTTGADAATGAGQPLESAKSDIDALSDAVAASTGWTLTVGSADTNMEFTTVVNNNEIPLTDTEGKVGTALKVRITNGGAAAVNYVLTLTNTDPNPADSKTIEVGEIAKDGYVDKDIQIPAGAWTLTGAIVTNGLTVTATCATSAANVQLNGTGSLTLKNKMTGDKITISAADTYVITGVTDDDNTNAAIGTAQEDGTWSLTVGSADLNVTVAVALKSTQVATAKSTATDAATAIETAFKGAGAAIPEDDTVATAAYAKIEAIIDGLDAKFEAAKSDSKITEIGETAVEEINAVLLEAIEDKIGTSIEVATAPTGGQEATAIQSEVDNKLDAWTLTGVATVEVKFAENVYTVEITLDGNDTPDSTFTLTVTVAGSGS